MSLLTGLLFRHWRAVVGALWIFGTVLVTTAQRQEIRLQGARLARCEAASAALAAQVRQARLAWTEAGRLAGEEARACDRRVLEARRSAAGIAALVSRAPATDAAGCPAREIIAGRELDAVFPPR